MTSRLYGPRLIEASQSIPLQRVTSLRRRAQDNVPDVSYLLRHVVDDSVVAETESIVVGVQRGACNAPLVCEVS